MRASFVSLALAVSFVCAQAPQPDRQFELDAEVSVDAIWHNRYHAVLAMAAYGDYETLCPQDTFTRANLLQSFPSSTSAPWTMIDTFNTSSGIEGFNVIIPEMDKIVTVFKGDYGIEQNINTTSVSMDALGWGTCPNCTANAQALEAYLEVREATNNFASAYAAVERTGHQWSVTGHGFGGMLAIIFSLDQGWAGRMRWSHNYGTPRTVNQAGADLFFSLFQGEAGERGVANADPIPEIIPASEDYVHVPLAFYYWGYNSTLHMNMNVCSDVSNPNCMPAQPYNITDHAFYFTPIGTCGRQDRYNDTIQEAYVSSVSSQYVATATALPSSAAASSLPAISSIVTESALLSAATLISSPAQDAAVTSTSTSSATKNGLAGSVGALLMAVIAAL